MSATSAINVPSRSGSSFALSMPAATILFAGILGALDGNGRAVSAADTAGLRVIGRVAADADNTLGADDGLTVTVERGVFRYQNSQANPIARANIGQDAFVEDNQTVATTTVHKVKAGRIVDVDADGVWIDTTVAGRVPTAFALTSAQNATAAAVDLPTAEALANANKAQGNALQTDLAALVAALKAQGILV